LCNRLHKFENVLSQVVTLEIWNLNVQNIGNWLHAHGNRLLLCKSVWKECWLLEIDYCFLVIDYQRVKLLVKDFSLKNSLEQNCAIQSFLLKKSFYTYLDAFLEVLAYLDAFLEVLAYLESSLESLLESWFFTWILTLHLTLDSWLNDSLILKTCFDSWFLTWVFGIIKINLESFASTNPSFSLPYACHVRFFALCLLANNHLNLGIIKRYQHTFARRSLVVVACWLPWSSFSLYCDTPHLGHLCMSKNWFMYNMQSLEHTCIFWYSMPTGHKIFFAL